jgi:hypothetical protein
MRKYSEDGKIDGPASVGARQDISQSCGAPAQVFPSVAAPLKVQLLLITKMKYLSASYEVSLSIVKRRNHIQM